MLGLAFLGLARTYLFLPVRVSGQSMAPTYRNGQLVWVNRLAYVWQTPQRGDVVVVRTPKDLIIKRVVGLENEEIAMSDGGLRVAGQTLAEPYVRYPAPLDIGAGRLEAHKYWVIGDNRPATAQAVVDLGRIVGKVVGSPPQCFSPP